MWILVMILCMALGMVGAYVCGCRTGRAEGYAERMVEEWREQDKEDEV